MPAIPLCILHKAITAEDNTILPLLSLAGPHSNPPHIIAVQTAQLTRNSRKDMERRTAHSPLICLDIFRLF